MILSQIKKSLLPLVCCGFASFAHADYSNVYVFGDSLSDIGNLRAVTQDPNIPERFTNGPVAVELVAAQLGQALSPSLHLLPPEVTGGVYGNNFAIASAIAIDEDGDLSTPDINLPTQIGAYLQLRGGQAESDALHIIMIGGNDLFAAQDIIINGSWGSYFKAYDRVIEASDSVKQQIQTLVATGAQNILVVNAANIGATPQTDLKKKAIFDNADSFRDYVIGWQIEGLSGDLTEVYNLSLELAVSEIEQQSGLDIKEYDLNATFNNILNNAESLGYTNKDDACVYALSGGGFNPECNFETFVFFDEIHPTAVTHERAAEDLLEVAQ
jgi:phospholipase/lecithinase/hemolysin